MQLSIYTISGIEKINVSSITIRCVKSGQHTILSNHEEFQSRICELQYNQCHMSNINAYIYFINNICKVYMIENEDNYL